MLKDEEIKVANRDYISASLSEEVEDNMKLVIAKSQALHLRCEREIPNGLVNSEKPCRSC
ncbi:hypothetical protein GCM10020331_019090 [Ectobacillus funiculus]